MGKDSEEVRTPVIADDSGWTRSIIRIVDLISEGPIYGLVQGGRSIFINGDRLGIFKEFNYSIQGVKVFMRLGHPSQPPITGWPYIENTFEVGQPVRSSANNLIINPGSILLGVTTVSLTHGINFTGGLGNPGTGFKETAVPTYAPQGYPAMLPEYSTSSYSVVLTHPGQNVINIGEMRMNWFNTSSGSWVSTALGGGYLGDVFNGNQLGGGVNRAIVNKNVNSVRVVIRIDKLYKTDGRGDIMPNTIRFAISARPQWNFYWTSVIPYNGTGYANFTYLDYEIPPEWGHTLGPPLSTGWGVLSLRSFRASIQLTFNGAGEMRGNMFYRNVTTGSGWIAFNASPFHRFNSSGNTTQNFDVGTGSTLALNTGHYYEFRLILDIQVGATTASLITLYYGVNGQEYVEFTGKVTNGIHLNYEVNIPPMWHDNGPVEIRVVKLSSDDVHEGIDAMALANAYGLKTDEDSMYWRAFLTTDVRQMTWVAYSEIIYNQMQYSDSAVCGLEFDSRYIGSLPTRAYDIYGRVIRVPSNYNVLPQNNNDHNGIGTPPQRYYDALWDGTFKLSWTDNPVWIFLDLLTHDRYGLGNWITDDMLDFGAFYQLARYCDEMIDNGYYTFAAPRFTFNTQIVNAEMAYNVLSMLASCFRGMIYWSAGTITATQDSPREPSRIVSPSNVINGEFSYSGSALNARHSVCLVTWNDPELQWKEAIQVYEDPELIDRYGYVTTELRAWGCTNRYQAMRMGRWILDTEKYATEVVQYRAGFDHADVVPGEVIAIADPMISGFRHGGRVSRATTQQIVMDTPYTFSNTEDYTITVHIPTWGLVNVVSGSNIVTGVQTQFLNPIKPVLGGQGTTVIIFHGNNKQYRVLSVQSNTQLTLSSVYTGPTLTENHFTIFSGTNLTTFAFYYSSLIPLIEAPLATISGSQDTINIDSYTLPSAPQPNVPFVITGQSVEPRLYRVVSVKEIEMHQYEIVALQHDPTKYARVEVPIEEYY